ncbi:MAG: DUF4366 domain-containing protein [Clostridia bacterium]|nr:DUF4366 domain-containing protein [Clostridia bacterium]
MKKPARPYRRTRKMRTKPARIFTTFLAVMLCMAAFSVNALAVNDTASVSTTSTPDGTGSVVSDTTNGDGKEFLTIETSDGNVFYLIIDKQKTGDNVYFLDTVTTKDLLSLTQSDSKDSGSSTATTDTAKNTQTSEASSTPGASSAAETSSAPAVSTTGTSAISQTGKQNSTVKMAAVIILLAVIVGVVILFLKLRKAKPPAKNEKDADEYDFLEDEDTEEKTEPQDEQESPDEETEREDE